MYINQWMVVYVTRKRPTHDISPSHPPNFHKGVNNTHSKFGLDFQPQSHLKRSGYETEQRVGKIKQDAQLSQRDRAAGCVIVFAKSRTLHRETIFYGHYRSKPLSYDRPENLSNSVKNAK